MFEIGDTFWYRGPGGPELIEINDEFTIGDDNTCHLCGAATDAPGCPLCPACAEEQEEQEQDARDERIQRGRPL